ncbi:MAG: three-Cys-motif partner protein TcmP [Terracidiphilus sp.]
MSSSLDDLRVEDDGLVCGEVGKWADTKYRLISLYDQLFSTGMKNKWEQRVYIDLYAGGGHGQIRGTDIRIKGSPILALDLPCPFDKYIFCDANESLLAALRIRAERIAPKAHVTYVLGNCDHEIEQICGAIPRASKTNRVLSMCLVDPFDFGIKFETIRRLSSGLVDFLVLLAVGMDAGRNYDHYVEGNNPKISEALGEYCVARKMEGLSWRQKEISRIPRY